MGYMGLQLYVLATSWCFNCLLVLVKEAEKITDQFLQQYVQQTLLCLLGPAALRHADKQYTQLKYVGSHNPVQ